MIITGIYAVLFLIITAMQIIMALFKKDATQQFSLFSPLFILVFTYCIVAIFCSLYNLVARWTGGIEMTVEEK